jgi:riboflavin kinase / FMN adenylyltransferase
MGKLVWLSEVARNPNTVLTVGSFDGVHQGHRSIIERVVTNAQSRGARSVVLTFDPHPREILSPGEGGVKLLTSLAERTEILSELGIDEMIVIPFNRDFSLLSSEDFIRKIVFDQIGVAEFIIGYDHQFGRNREGTIETLRRIATELDFDVNVVEAHEVANVTISSTLVRRKLELEGDIDLARTYLGRAFRLTGTVVHGDKRGRTIGYPTANLRPMDFRKVIPQNGVYAVDVHIDSDLKIWRGMMNIGVRPTVSAFTGKHIEVHLIGFEGDLYGRLLHVDFLRRIRDERRFDGLESLREQLNRDKQACLSAG